MALRLNNISMGDLIKFKVTLLEDGKLSKSEGYAVTKYLAFIIDNEVEAI